MIEYLQTDIGVMAKAELPAWQEYFGYKGALDVHFGEGECEAVEEIRREMLEDIVRDPEALLNGILSYLLEIYPAVREIYACFFEDEDMEESLPEKVDRNSFSRLLSPSSIVISDVMHEGVPLVGVGFGCTWEQEHGFGLLMYRNRGLDWGEESISFVSWMAEEALEKMTQTASDC